MAYVVSHYVGLDLGKPSEFTALAVLEGPRRGCVPEDAEAPVYSLRYLRRWSPGTGYPEVVVAVTELARCSPLHGEATVLVDQTGVGRTIVDLFRRVPGRLVPMVVTGGMAFTYGTDGAQHMPKVELIGVVQVLLQTRRLKIARDLADADLLVQELDRYREKPPAIDGPEVWREGSNDDLVLAVALACWQAERQPPMAVPQWIGEPRRRMNLQEKCKELARTRPHRGLFGQWI